MQTVAIIRQATKTKLNVLSFCTHERYQNNMSNVNANFFLFRNPDVKNWDFRYAKLPENHYLLPRIETRLGEDYRKVVESIPRTHNFDLVLSQSKAGQYQIARMLCHALHVPMVTLEHTSPMPGWSQSYLHQIRDTMRGNINVFITDNNRREWGWEGQGVRVIKHAVDTNVFCDGQQERQKSILTVANEYNTRGNILGFDLYKSVTHNLPTRPVGDTPGFSKPANDLQDLVDKYQTTLVFLNTANVSPIPMSLLEAMACGCACVSMSSKAIPEYISHQHNGYLAKNPQQMRNHLEWLLSNPHECHRIGQNAVKTIKQKCDKVRFTNEWNEVLREASQIAYTGDF